LFAPFCRAIAYDPPQYRNAPFGFPMKAYILLVTRLIPGQPPNNYQVMFYSEEACIAARDAVLTEGRRVKAEHDKVQIDAGYRTEPIPLPSQRTIAKCFGRFARPYIPNSATQRVQGITHQFRLLAQPRHLRLAPAVPYSGRPRTLVASFSLALDPRKQKWPQRGILKRLLLRCLLLLIFRLLTPDQAPQVGGLPPSV
jgi:hypothetical protein